MFLTIDFAGPGSERLKSLHAGAIPTDAKRMEESAVCLHHHKSECQPCSPIEYVAGRLGGLILAANYDIWDLSMTPEKQKAIHDPESLFVEAEHFEEKGEFKRAFQCLLTAAELEHSSSQLNLGNFYASGKGIKRNLEEAAHWYKKAYKNGQSAGAHNLAIDLREQGNTRSAEIWFRKAIAMKDGSAYLALAKMYMPRRNGKKAAARLLEKALLLSRSDISEDEKEEAESLLKKLARA